MIKGVFFDLGDTLLRNENVSIERSFNGLKKYIPALTREHFDKIVSEKLDTRDENEVSIRSLLIELLNEYKIFGLDIVKIEVEYNRNLFDCRVVDNAIEYLEKLKKAGLKLFVVSNSCFSIEAIKDIVDMFGLTKYFDDIFVSSMVGYRKPSHIFMEYAINKSGLKADEIIMIGNTFSTDIIGASRVKMNSMLFDETGKYHGNEDPYLIKVFSNFSELMQYELIDELILKKRIDKDAFEVVNILKNNGYEAYIVGGSIRNALLGIKINDYDFTTNALPTEVKDIFSKEGYHVVPTGEKHGTITIIKDDNHYEVTTFRTDGKYKDFRHPEDVSFGVSLEEDLARRDFTINAMCYDGEKLIDLFGAREDLVNGVIKAIGDPMQRFKEDALRIMRALRFACYLGFDIEKNTHNAIINTQDLLKRIAIERINDEVLKMAAYPCLAMIKKYKKIFELIYAYKISNPNLDKLDETGLSSTMRFAIFGPKLEHKWTILKLSNKIASEIMVYQKINSDIDYSLYSFRFDIVKYGRDQILNNFNYLKIIYDWEEDRVNEVIRYYKESLNYPINVNELDIDGTEINRYGITQQMIKKCKEDILKLVLLDELENNNKDIKEYIEKSINNYK